jgi:hypothetical protein
MKITVLIDDSGKVLGASYIPPSTIARPASANSSAAIRIKAARAQRLHEVDLPAELSSHVLEGTLPKEIFKFHVEVQGKTAKLVKSAGAKKN